MKHFVEYRCPGCGMVVGGTTRRRATIGRSFEQCTRCDAYVARVPFQEWALMSSRTKVASLVPGGLVALVLGLLPLALIALLSLALGEALDAPDAIALGAGGLSAAAAVWGTWFARRLAASRRRMADPWYQAKLAQFAIQSSRSSAARSAADSLPMPTRTL